MLSADREGHLDDKAGQAMTTHFDPIAIAGSDPRLQSQFCSRGDGSLRIDDVPEGYHRVLYGPHVALPVGHYRFELQFAVEAPSPKGVEVELSVVSEPLPLYMRKCFDWELQRGLIRIAHQLDRPADYLELRLYAGSGFVATVKQLTISLFPG